MTFKLCESQISDYFHNGYVVFRQILPPSLIGDLRREADKAVEIARRVRDANAQRLQPLQKYADELDMQPFRDYAQLPALNEAVKKVLSPEHYYGVLDIMGILLSPGESAYSTTWHRDISPASTRLSAEEFQDLILDWNSASQINCALYDDDCTWFVPGSHLRTFDLPGELAASKPPGPVVHGRSVTSFTDPVERERACWNYTAGMPGAVQLRLNPGDFALYRNNGWHIGNYVPYKKRATLHDGVWTPTAEKWWRECRTGASPGWKRQVMKRDVVSV